MVFIHKRDLKEVFLFLILDGQIVSTSMNDLMRGEFGSEDYENARDHIYQALGYEPKFSFEPEKFVLVEGKADEGIIV